MKISYDPRYNIAYIHFRDKVEPVKTVRVSDEMNVDMASDGKIYGIELLNANHQMAFGNSQFLTLVNEAIGQTQEIPLS